MEARTDRPEGDRETEARRRRIRDLTHEGERWIVSLRAEPRSGAGWRGRLRFFLDEPDRSETVTDGLVLEGLAFGELVAQATSLGIEELRGRLRRFRGAAGVDGRRGDETPVHSLSGAAGPDPGEPGEAGRDGHDGGRQP